MGIGCSNSRQLVVRNHGTYDIQTILDVTKNIKVVKVEVKRLLPILDSKLWEEDDNVITPRQVLDNLNNYPYHADRIFNANMDYPIILFDLRDKEKYAHLTRSDGFDIVIYGNEFDVLDGLHRLCKAVLTKDKYIRAKIISWEDLQRAKTNEMIF